MARGRSAPVFWATCIVLLVLNGGYPLIDAAGLPRDTPFPQATTYLVDSNDDAPDQILCDGWCATSSGTCTLRAAIDEANCDGVASTIKFASRFQDLAAIHDCDLNLTEDGTTIDASDMWDSVDDIPGVYLSGACFSLLDIAANAITVYGLLIGGSSIGIYVTGAYNTIGGSGAGQRNLFLGDGLYLWSGSGHNVVVNNQFGTLDRWYAQGAGTIVAETDYNTIADNLIYGLDAGIGIEIRGSYNTLSGNIVGVTWNGQQARPLQQGLLVKHGDGNVIGPNNIIAGNTGTGIEISDGRDNVVQGNHIGSFQGVGNGGVGLYVFGADNTLIQDNLIAHNGGHGLSVDGSDVTVLGNTIEDNGGDGIYLDSASGDIGGPTSQERNTIGNNEGNGVHLTSAGPLTIAGNCIGLDNSCAYDNGNKGHGILLDAASANNTIGGDGPGEGNWIAWNRHDGIRLTGEGTTLNFVQGNVVGAPVSWGFAAPNGWHGISLYDGADYNVIGGLGDYMANTILASTWTGLAVVNGDGNVLLGNRIGTDGAGHDYGNTYYGIYVMGAENTVSFNEVAYNLGEAGVEVDGAASTGNALLFNSIHDHSGKGIALANGGNTNLPAPILTGASCAGPVTGTACPGCNVEVFSDADDEGRFVEGSTTADAVTGAFSFSGSVAGPYVTATATDANDNTSEFSAPFHVGACNTAPDAAFTIQPATGPVNKPFTFDASTSSDHEDPTSALNVRWDWQNDGVYDTAWTKDKTATHAFDLAAVHTIRLQVKDSGGLTDTTSHSFSVEGGLLPNRVYLPLVRR
jgi:parallel beta-helix repeat protein